MGPGLRRLPYRSGPQPPGGGGGGRWEAGNPPLSQLALAPRCNPSTDLASLLPLGPSALLSWPCCFLSSAASLPKVGRVCCPTALTWHQPLTRGRDDASACRGGRLSSRCRMPGWPQKVWCSVGTNVENRRSWAGERFGFRGRELERPAFPQAPAQGSHSGEA